MTKWRVLVEYEEAFTGAKIIEIDADDWSDGLAKLKEKIKFLEPENFVKWRGGEEWKTWKKQQRYLTRNYLLNMFEPDYVEGSIMPLPKKEGE